MGYYSVHRVSVLGDERPDHPFLYELAEISGYGISIIRGHHEAKWYSHEGDMIELSKRHPETTFLVRRIGEARGDDWRYSYLAGGVIEEDNCDYDEDGERIDWPSRYDDVAEDNREEDEGCPIPETTPYPTCRPAIALALPSPPAYS